MEKETKISKIIDKDSYDELIGIYKEVKNNKQRYALDDFIRVKSFFNKMISRQHEIDKEGRKVWATPKEYFDNRFNYIRRFCGNQFKTRKEMLIEYFIDDKNIEYTYGYNPKEDYGKIL